MNVTAHFLVENLQILKNHPRIYRAVDELARIFPPNFEQLLMNVRKNTDTEHFFSAVCNAVINSDQCQACFACLRSVTACLPEIFCPKPSVNCTIDMCDTIGIEMRRPLLSDYKQGNHQPCLKSDQPALVQIEYTLQDHEPWSFPQFPTVPYISLSDESTPDESV